MASGTRNRFTVAVGIGLMVIAGSGTLYFKTKADAMQQIPKIDRAEAKVVVDVYRMVAQQHTLRFEARGVLEGIQETTVSAEVEGVVLSKPVSEGQRVRPGDLLCQIDPTFHKLTLRQALAKLDGATADLSSAEAVLAKMRELEMSNKTELELKQYTSRRDQAKAAENLAAAEVEQARERLARCRILSPIAGVVSRVYFEEGELLPPMAPAVDIINDDQMKLVVQLPDFEASQIEANTRVTIASSARPGETFIGVVHTIFPKADPSTRRVPIEIRIDNPGGELRSGLFVNCVIQSDSTSARLLAPTHAVRHEFGTTYCYVAEPIGGSYVVRRRTVTTTPLPGSVILLEIRAGLQENELLIVNKHSEISPEQVIAIRPAASSDDPLSQATPGN